MPAIYRHEWDPYVEFEGWHFQTSKKRLGRQPEIGMIGVNTILVVTGKIEICRWGLHASEMIVDAMRYAPGNRCCRVSLTGEETMFTQDKFVSRSRRIDWSVNMDEVLRAIYVEHLPDLGGLGGYTFYPQIVNLIRNNDYRRIWDHFTRWIVQMRDIRSFNRDLESDVERLAPKCRSYRQHTPEHAIVRVLDKPKRLTELESF